MSYNQWERAGTCAGRNIVLQIYSRLITVYGGVLIRDEEGELLGAIGVTGDTGENDERIAVAALDIAAWWPI